MATSMSLALVLDVHLSLLVMAVLVWEQGALLLLLCWAMLELMLCTIGLVAGTPLLRISAVGGGDRTGGLSLEGGLRLRPRTGHGLTLPLMGSHVEVSESRTSRAPAAAAS